MKQCDYYDTVFIAKAANCSCALTGDTFVSNPKLDTIAVYENRIDAVDSIDRYLTVFEDELLKRGIGPDEETIARSHDVLRDTFSGRNHKDIARIDFETKKRMFRIIGEIEEVKYIPAF